jgi:hypothetical protein
MLGAAPLTFAQANPNQRMGYALSANLRGLRG